MKKYRNIYNEIKKGNLYLKKGEQLTQENIICMDKYGRQAEGDTSFNEIDDNEDHGFYKEIINTNTIDTDRIFTKGKPIEGKKLGFIQHKKEKNKKKDN